MLLTIATCAVILQGAVPATDEDLLAISVIPEGAVEKQKRLTRYAWLSESREYFVDDKRVALREYFDNGELAEEKFFRNGKLHGIWRQFHRTGKLFAERPYRDGMMDGEFRFWDEGGELMGSSKMQRDSGLLREFQHPYLSVLDAETPYRNGRKHGQVITWAKYMQCQGLGVSVRRFVDGKAEGNSFVRDDDGLLLSWASYRDGQLHGAWHYVDREGDPAEGCPKYFIRGEEVSETQLRDAALSDRDLAASLKFTPPKYAKVPESPSAAFAKKKQAQKSADSSTGIEKQ